MKDAINFDWELNHALADDSDDTEIGGLDRSGLHSPIRSPGIDGPGPFPLAAIAGERYLYLWCIGVWSLAVTFTRARNQCDQKQRSIWLANSRQL